MTEFFTIFTSPQGMVNPWEWMYGGFTLAQCSCEGCVVGSGVVVCGSGCGVWWFHPCCSWEGCVTMVDLFRRKPLILCVEKKLIGEHLAEILDRGKVIGCG